MQELFTEARNNQPSIVVIDEFESYDRHSTQGHNRDEIMFEEINRQLEGTVKLVSTGLPCTATCILWPKICKIYDQFQLKSWWSLKSRSAMHAGFACANTLVNPP